MTISIWRYSHLTLAISSFIYIFIAAVTGFILAIEPIENQLKPYSLKNNNISVAQTLASLKKEHKEIVFLKVNQHHLVSASVITKQGKSQTFYINPVSGKKISSLKPKASIYKFTTNLHRSLFLKSTGRIIVAFFTFLLLLITISGIFLTIKRQGGIKKIFSKVIYEDFNQFYHVVLSRYFFIPILIIIFSGILLSLEKLSILPTENIKHNYNFNSKSSTNIPIENFNIFKDSKLSTLKSLEFPFSDDTEDYFFLKLKDKEVLIHQYSGEIVSSRQYTTLKNILSWSLFLHTGRGSITWSILLLTSCCAILFFIYSGFSITINRRKKHVNIKNKFKKETAETIILVGSESNNTINTAYSFYNALLNAEKTVFIDILNNYTSYPKATNLIIFTATYGEGEAPTNAGLFLHLLNKIKQPNHIQYAVVGFGSLAYKYFCKYAIDIDSQLNEKEGFTKTLPLTKINNQNFNDFKSWVLQWNEQTHQNLTVKQTLTKPTKQNTFEVISKTNTNSDNTFILRLKTPKKLHFTSGDLLAITPKQDNIKRLYSIGKIDNDILLSIKKHELGICSQLLSKLNTKEKLQASIEQNKEFHFPKKSKEVILIANGTGIAPFLGTLNNKTKTHIFYGVRTKASINIYKPFLNNKNLHLATSREGKKQYVQDLLIQQENLIVEVLNNKGTIMICGSITMMKDVLNVIENTIKTKLNKDLSFFKKQIKTDCY